MSTTKVDYEETLKLLRTGIAGRTFLKDKVLPLVEDLIERLPQEDEIADLRAEQTKMSAAADKARSEARAATKRYDDLMANPSSLVDACKLVVGGAATLTEESKKLLTGLLVEFNDAWFQEAVGNLGEQLMISAEAIEAERRAGSISPETQALLKSVAKS